MFGKRVGCLAGALAVMLVVSGCSTPQVRYDIDAKVNLANYHSYVWEQPEVEEATTGGPAFNNPLNEQRLRDAVETQLAARGLRPAAEGTKPDSYVTIAVGTRQAYEHQRRYPVRVGFGFSNWWRPGFGSAMYMYDDDFYDYREGRISVNLYDAATRKPIWFATVEQDLTYLTGDDAAKRINTVVAAMFTKFPVGK